MPALPTDANSAGKAGSSLAGKKKPAPAEQLQRPRFAESLEGRRMLTAAGPINFQPAHFYQEVTGNVQVGHFINGGLPDLVGTDGTNNEVHILLNNGDGTFRAGQTFYVPDARSATVGDFNHDGNQDIAVASPTTNGDNNNDQQDTIYIFYGRGDGTFQGPPRLVPIDFQIQDMASADLNGDGFDDIIATIGRRAIVLINRGNDTFFGPVGYAAGAQFSGQLVVGDFNSDSIPDIAVVRYQSNELAILLGQKNLDGTPTGTFGKREIYHVGTNPRALAVGDFNGDGKEDLAVVNSDFRQPGLYVFLGNGDGTFNTPQAYHGGNFVDGVATGDFNGDGQTDIATVSFTSYLRAYAGNGDGTFQPLKEFGTSSFGQNVVSSDFNGDGLNDVAVATGGGIRVLLATNSTTPPPTPTSQEVTLSSTGLKSITYKDVSGSSATLSLSGPGEATVDFTGDNLTLNGNGTRLIGGTASISSIVASGTTSDTTLAIKPIGINGLVSLGPISTDGSFKAILAPRATLAGDLTVAGTVGNLLFDTASGGTITLGAGALGAGALGAGALGAGALGAGAQPANLNVRNASDETLTSAQPIGSLSVGQWYSSTTTPTTITAPSIRSIRSTSQFSANLTVGSGGLQSVNVRNIPQGTWNIAGPVGQIYAARDIQVTLTAPTINRLQAINAMNNVYVVTTGNIGAVSAGSFTGTSIYAGVKVLPNGQRFPETTADFTSSARIGSVSLSSRSKLPSFVNSSIAAPTLGRMSLGVIIFTNFGQTQGLAAESIGSFSGADQASKKLFALRTPSTLTPLMQKGINTADFVLSII